MDVAVFIAIALCLAMNFAGYLYALFLMQLVRPIPALPEALSMDDADLPHMHVIIATHNEAKDIEAKLENTAALAYPRDKLTVIIADGGSTDGTPDLAETWADQRMERDETAIDVRVMRLEAIGKVRQINAALMMVPQADNPMADFVVITDADAQITTEDALLTTAGLLKGLPGPTLIGGWTEPPSDPTDLAGQMELMFWQKMNRQRHMETESFSASIVVAPFYAFPRLYFRGWPVDCVADDVNISLQFRDRGGRIVYTPRIRVIETRQPASLKQMVAHKLRKTNAYAMEVLRYSYRLPFLGLRDRVLLAFKFFQFFIMPVATIAFGVWSLYFLATAQFLLLGAIYGTLLILVAVASVLASRSPVEEVKVQPARRRLVLSMGIFVLMLWVLIANMLLYPFWQQNARYERVGEAVGA